MIFTAILSRDGRDLTLEAPSRDELWYKIEQHIVNGWYIKHLGRKTCFKTPPLR